MENSDIDVILSRGQRERDIADRIPADTEDGGVVIVSLESTATTMRCTTPPAAPTARRRYCPGLRGTRGLS